MTGTVLDEYPVPWASPAVQQVLRILQGVYRVSDIEAIVTDAGLDPAGVAWDARPANTWRSAFDYAASQCAVGSLLDTVAAARPALKVRLDELRSQPDPVLAGSSAGQPADEPVTWKNFSGDGQAEAVIVSGQPTFVNVSFLAVGLDRARSVCRLVTRFPGEGSGTGFRVGAGHILTNYHVLFDAQHEDRKVTSVQAWFNYEADQRGNLKTVCQIGCDPGSVTGEKADDWAIIRATEPIPDAFPVLPVLGSRVPEIDDRVYIIQHPQGQPKKVAFQHNLVRYVGPETLQYWTDTDLGSSGSPVFDETWSVVGLHHFSVPAPQGDRISVRNQGRRIDRVVERMQALRVYPGAGR